MLNLESDTVCISSGIFQLTGGSPLGGTYSGVGVSGINFDPIIAGNGYHSITYSYTDENDCSNSTTTEVFVDICSGLKSFSNFDLKISPNPFSKSTTLQTGNRLNDATLKVYNLFGQEVKEMKNISGQTVAIERDNLSSGVYFIQLIEANKTMAMEKLIIAD